MFRGRRSHFGWEKVTFGLGQGGSGKVPDPQMFAFGELVRRSSVSMGRTED